MKDTVKTSRTAGYLEKIFRVLNEHYFNNVIDEPIITIQATPRAYGHVTVSKAWSKANGETQRELNIGAGTLSRPIENVVATMLHEMVHLAQLQSGVKGTSRGGQYHNVRFKAAAEACDLKVSYDPRIGWSITEPTDELLELILEQGWTEIKMTRNDGMTATGIGGSNPNAGNGLPPLKPKGNSQKIQCPCCGASVRATRAGLRILCMDCGVQMQYV